LIETALAHVIGDKAEQADRRSDALEKRRALMETWAGLRSEALGERREDAAALNQLKLMPHADGMAADDYRQGRRVRASP
jgi:hypothetical protein